MTAFQQISYDSQNLLDDEYLSAYAGAAISPVNYSPSVTQAFVERLRVRRPGDFDFILDPQLYFPNSDRGFLTEWEFFPSEFDSSDRNSQEFWSAITDKVAKTGKDIRAQFVASPADVPKSYDNGYFARLVESGARLADLADERFVPMQSAIVSLNDFDEPTRALKVASLLSATPCPWLYLMIDATAPPRRELSDASGLLGVMQLIYAIEQAGIRVFVAYSSSDVLLWKAAGATACATGKFFNVRRFTRSRFEEKSESGGGAVEYWFEESLLAFIRQDDLLRLHRDGLLSAATRRNPLFPIVLETIQTNKAWFKLSWTQYLFWFAEVEGRLDSGGTSAMALIDTADKAWTALDEHRVVLSDRLNTGDWLRRWKQALLDFAYWRQARESLA